MVLTSAITSAYLSVFHWKLSTQPLPGKIIVIDAPHTSNRDDVFMAISMWKSGHTFSLLVKDSVVKASALGWFVKETGAIAAERSASHDLVEQVAQRIREADTFALCTTPKGTRSPRVFWKSGFYRIAMEASMPIQLGLVGRNIRTFGWGPTYQLTGDVHADIEAIRTFYANKAGIHPEKAFVPRLRAEDEVE